MNQILQRKLRPSEPPRASAMAAGEESWSLHVARALRDSVGMTAQVRAGASHEADLQGLPAALPEDALLMLLETPLGDAGVLAVTNSVVAAMIEMQTTGEVFERAAEPHTATRIDAALVTPVIDQALASLATATQADTPKEAKTPPFICTNYLDEAATVALLLDDVSYCLHRADLRFGDGSRSGTILIALPQITHDAPKAQAAADNSPELTLADVTGEARCVLTAILCKMRLPLETALRFAPGQILHLGGARLSEITLEGQDGAEVAAAKLGQNGGLRALRLTACGREDHDAPAFDAPQNQTGFAAAAPAAFDFGAPADPQAHPQVAGAFDADLGGIVAQTTPAETATWPQSELDVSALLAPQTPTAPLETGGVPLDDDANFDADTFSSAAFAPLDFDLPAGDAAPETS